jgi:hypothetical protein
MFARLLPVFVMVAVGAASASAALDALPQEPAREAVPSAAPAPEAPRAAAAPTPAMAPAEPMTVPTTTPAPPSAPAPMRIAKNARLYVEPSDFGMALSAALLKKEVPVVVLTNKEKADFFVQTIGAAKQEATATKVTRMLVWGTSGDRFDATVTITNRDEAIVFARSAKKGNFKDAAEDIAKNLKKQIEDNED